MTVQDVPSKSELVSLFNELVRKYAKDKSIVLTDDTDIKEVGIDSIDIMEVVFEIEEKYQIEIDDVNVLQVDSFGQLVDALHNDLLKEAAAK